MPGLPLPHSRMMDSGRSSPRASASSRTLLARRSLTLPLGLRNSHLAWMVTPSRSKRNDTSGVSPISDRTACARLFFGCKSDMQQGCATDGHRGNTDEQTGKTLPARGVTLARDIVAPAVFYLCFIYAHLWLRISSSKRLCPTRPIASPRNLSRSLCSESDG